MKKILRYITGGRPMNKGKFIFTSIDLRGIHDYHEYTDSFNRTWIAESSWDIFRRKKEA